MARQPAYSEEQKTAALAVFAERGLTSAARETGIPKMTIWRWAKVTGTVTATVTPTKKAEVMAAGRQANAERIVVVREGLRLHLIEKADDLLDRMDKPHVDFKGKDAQEVTYPVAPAAAVQNYATSVGILIDKFRLESGETTAKTEHSGTVEGRIDVVNWRPDDAFLARYARVLQEAGLLDDDEPRLLNPGDVDVT
jgi:hypothetical protein